MGPYIQVATFCADVSRDAVTSNLSISRFITVANVKLIGEAANQPPGEPTAIATTLVVTMWAGGLTGVHRVQIVPVDPQEQRQEPLYSADVNFRGDSPLEGHDVIMRIVMPLFEGLYWFEVVVSAPDGSDQRTIGRIPLDVHIEREGRDPETPSG
jgi:hypothetical protein